MESRMIMQRDLAELWRLSEAILVEQVQASDRPLAPLRLMAKRVKLYFFVNIAAGHLAIFSCQHRSQSSGFNRSPRIATTA